MNDLSDLQRLNEGNGGVAYKGYFRHEIPVVIKQPKREQIGCEEWLELQLHMALPEHPNVVPFLGICMMQTQMYFVTRFIEQGSLKSLLSDDQQRSKFRHPLTVMRAGIDIASALCHLHAHRICHRDVSARNVLVRANGSMVIADLGLSRWMQLRDPTMGQSSNNGLCTNSQNDKVLFGDEYKEIEVLYEMERPTALPARWTSPESLRTQQYTGKSDVWSLGVTLYEMLSGGRLPYMQIKENMQVIALVASGDIRLHIESDWSVPTDLVDIVMACLTFDPKLRPDMFEIKERMERLVTQSVRAYPEYS
jgi:serine/threonine protein kinase